MITEQLTAKRVAELATELSGLPFDASRVRTLLAPHRARVLGAIKNKDARALAAITALGTVMALAEAAYAGEFSGPQLADHVRAHGWELIDAVLAGEPGAHEALLAAQCGLPVSLPRPLARSASTPVSSSAPIPGAALSCAPPPRRHDTSNVVTIWGPSGPPKVMSPSAGSVPALQLPEEIVVAPPAAIRTGPVPQPAELTAGVAALTTELPRPTFAKQARAWGKKAALNVEASATRAGEPTVVLEAARAMVGDGGYDWGKKIVLQLTPAELQLATALFLGQIDHPVEGRNHGPGHNKWFSLERQVERFAGTYKVVIGDGRDTMIVQIGADAKLGSMVALLAKQCAAQMEVEVSDLATLLRPVATAYNAAHAAASNCNDGKRAG